ncbi:uncharacterized protein At4g38062-like [Solanum pennellii]|uniref:Uncharacterized protein At4g38062-like n=1 Tax=Solanum pennellii TaxID=28526 RepID=A0ABM1HQT1_SOLPN|nr:uncharacterized protein At4g38062-like [Solanum pennellii]XP_015089007.1 uncharacterized protein At4g38062-like [Solanum pennellii]XP_015089008.1 uncharacterized protein At4g38062-like [Solanum pennellii]
MDKVYEELDVVKGEVEKLREECRTKTEMTESLRKAHIDQLSKLQEAKLEIDRQANELFVKSEEIFEIKKLYDDIKSNLHEKESCVQNLSSAHEKLQLDYGKKIGKLEVQNKDLVLALDEATSKFQDLEMQISASNKEINALKQIMSVRQEIYVESELKTRASKDLKDGDAIIQKLDEENRIAKDQLKWKSEQFKHLEEAHKRNHDQFKTSKVEWVREKSAMLEEISSLQARLDSQTQISEDLQSQLSMSNQALAHRESRRKILEIELSEFRSRFHDISLECHEANSKLENLTIKRDEEIGELRNILQTKEALFKDTKCKNLQLEQENQDLRRSLKELQESQLQGTATSVLKKLQSNYQYLKQLHKKCSLNLKEKEVEWSSQIRKVAEDMKRCMSELNGKEKHIDELEKELEDCRDACDVLTGEISVLILVLKSEFHTGRKELSRANAEQEPNSKSLVHQKSEQATVLEAQLIEYKKMLEESSDCQVQLREQVLKLGNALKDASAASEEAKDDLAKAREEVKESKLELEKWKAEAGNLKDYLEGNQFSQKQEKEILLGILKEGEAKINELQQQITEAELKIVERTEAANDLNQEKRQYYQIAEDKDNTIEILQTKISCLEQKLADKDLQNEQIQSDVRKAFDQEKENILLNLKEKDRKIQDILKQAKDLEEDMTCKEVAFTALITAEGLKLLEIKEKNKVIAELELKLGDTHQKLEVLNKSLSDSRQTKEQLEILLQESKKESEELNTHFGNERMHLEARIQELESHKNDVLEENKKFFVGREELLVQMQGIHGRMSELCCEDVELVRHLDKILENPEEENEHQHSNLGRGHHSRTPFSTAKIGTDERTPLVELNC